jgi:hypothetical protein
MKRFMRLPQMLTVLFTMSAFNPVYAAPSSENFVNPFWIIIAFAIGLIAFFNWLYKDNHNPESHENPYRPPKMRHKVNRVNKERQPYFRAELIHFLKSRGYPAGNILCNAKIGETHVDYLIMVPNTNENLAIINDQRLDDNLAQMKRQIMTAQRLDDNPAPQLRRHNPAQLRRQLEICRQKMGEPDYPVCILTASDEPNSQYPFALYHLDNNRIFKEVSLESFPTFQALSLNSQPFVVGALAPKLVDRL